MNPFVRNLLPYFLCVAILFVVGALFMAPQFSGKILQGENVQNAAMSEEARQYHEKTGEITRWTNSMFGGMPTYSMYGGGKAGLSDKIGSVFKLFTGGPLGYFLILLIASYAGFIMLGAGPWLSLMGALAAGFASTHIGVLEASHNSKLASAAYTILAIAGIYRAFRRDYLLGGFAFTLAVTLSISHAHPQMTYYFLLAGGVFSLPFIYDFIRKKAWRDLAKVLLVLIAGSLVALSANLYQTVTIRGFAADTMRGGSILSPTAERVQSTSVSESSESGLGYQYAMQWSDGVRDLLAMVIPGAVGGANIEKVAGNNSINALLRERGFQPQPLLPMYWGDLSFTGSPDYMGAIICLLFLFGLFWVKGPVKWGMAVATILLVLMSLGKNFDLLNRFLFEHLPLLNKFRTPNSIHNVTSCLIPLFAIYTLWQVLELEKGRKGVLGLFVKVLAGIAGFILLFGIGGGLFFDFTAAGDARYDPALVNVLKEARAIYLRQDAFRTLFFVLAGGILLYLFLREKLKKGYLLAGLAILSFLDLFGVARRYLSPEDWQSKTVLTQGNPKRPVDQQILEDPQLYYRVLDLGGDPFQNASPSFYHKSVGGYHPAKLRRYQDIIDAYLVKGDQKMLNMLNTKYIITQDQQAQLNAGAMGNAWLVGDIRKVASPDEEIASIRDIDPAQTAVVLDREFPGYLTSGSFSRQGRVTLTKYEPNALTYASQAEGDQFAVFSDIWYGPDKGWQAYVDGQPADHIRVNYIFRGMKIPSGSHTIEFKFVPVKVLRSIELGFWLNNLVGLLLLGLFGWLFYSWYKSVQSSPVMVQTAPPAVKPDKPGPKRGKKP